MYAVVAAIKNSAIDLAYRFGSAAPWALKPITNACMQIAKPSI